MVMNEFSSDLFKCVQLCHPGIDFLITDALESVCVYASGAYYRNPFKIVN